MIVFVRLDYCYCVHLIIHLSDVYFVSSLVIDTAYLYERVASKTDSPSLREIAKHVLNVSLPEIHDSVRDAGMCICLFICI